MAMKKRRRRRRRRITNQIPLIQPPLSPSSSPEPPPRSLNHESQTHHKHDFLIHTYIGTLLRCVPKTQDQPANQLIHSIGFQWIPNLPTLSISNHEYPKIKNQNQTSKPESKKNDSSYKRLKHHLPLSPVCEEVKQGKLTSLPVTTPKFPTVISSFPVGTCFPACRFPYNTSQS